MEVFTTPDHIIVVDGVHSLWFPRIHANYGQATTSSNESPSKSLPSLSYPPMVPKKGVKMETVPNALFIGVCYGVIGRFHNNKLLVIREKEHVGFIPGPNSSNDPVFKINRVAVLDPLTIDEWPPDLDQTPEIDNLNNYAYSPFPVSSRSPKKIVKKTWNSLKTVQGQLTKGSKLVVSKASNISSSLVSSTTGVAMSSMSTMDSREKVEKRLMDELVKMFSESDSFYFCQGDLTNTSQRKYQLYHPMKDSQKQMSQTNDGNLTKLDDRFFWNKYMLDELIMYSIQEESLGISYAESLARHWIVPIVQGFFQYAKCPPADAFSTEELNYATDCDIHKLGQSTRSVPQGGRKEALELVIILISRRSRFRAGTRYKRRGVDDAGKVANYVETEQIIICNNHVVSFTQVRGSVPVYWTQQGSSYRPPPKLIKSDEENQRSFKAHFQDELAIYDTQVIINLIQLSGREKVLGDAYLHNILTLNSPDLIYISFDFHEYCRGMKWENVSILIESISDIIKEMKFCWVDDQGLICRQEGVFRVNCVDCLDRTNVVQTAIAKYVLETQLMRLGIVPPEGQLPTSWKSIFQSLWANNGDAISKQYAGTNALKSDFTRTGERKLAGMVKDSYNSATRYYQNRFRDVYRQAVIDIMLGVPVSDIELTSPDVDDASDDPEHHERVKQVIEDVKKLLIPESEVILGGWPLIDCDPSDSNQSLEMDTVLILTQDAYFVSDYDEVTDRVTKCQKVLLEDIERIEIGPDPSSSFRSKMTFSASNSYCIRIFHLIHGEGGFFHAFKSTGTRFFNNMAIPVKSQEDEVECLKAIVESFKVALIVKSLNVPVFEGRLERKRNRITSSQVTERSPSLFIKNISESNPLGIKSVGSKVSSHLARFKGKLTGTPTPSTVVKYNPSDAIQAGNKHLSDSATSADVDGRLVERIDEKSIHLPKRSSHNSPTPQELSEVSNYSASCFVQDDSDYYASDLEDDVLDVNDGSKDREITPVPESCTKDGQNKSVFLESCGILSTVSPPVKYPSEMNITSEISGEGKTRLSSSRQAMHGTDEIKREKSLSRVVGKTDFHVTSGQSSSMGLIPPQMPNTVSMINMLDKADSCHVPSKNDDLCREKGSSCTNIPLVNNNECLLAETVRVTHEAFEDLPKYFPNSLYPSSGNMIRKQSPSSSPLAVKKELVISSVNKIAQSVKSFGLGVPSASSTVSPSKKRLDTLMDDYDEMKKRKRNSKTRIIEL